MAEKKDNGTKEQSNTDKVFTKLSKGAKYPPHEDQILASTFSKQGNMFKSKRYFVLYPDCIYYFNEASDTQAKGYTLLDFELRFEIIRDKDTPNSKDTKKNLGRAKGIRFDRDGCQSELYGEENEIIKWRDHLRKKINQRGTQILNEFVQGFHDLYKAQRKIGKGSFASVYLAERLEDEIMFAVKAFSKEAAYGQEKGKEAIITELQLMRQLDHPNIMKLHEVFETDNSLYFILDLLEGGQLYDKIKSKNKFTEEQTKIIMKGLVGAVAHMHERDIMHRDLKPENILFRTEDFATVVIADLGLGTKVSLSEYLFVRCGTPGFVAPEVVNIKDLHTTYGPVCDMFSLGLIFHILLLRKSPFNGKTYNEVLAQNREGTVKLEGPEYLRIKNDAYDLLKKMLQKEPEKRIQSQDAIKHPYFTSKPKQDKNIDKKVQNTSNTDGGSEFEDNEVIEDEVNVSKKMKNLDTLKKSTVMNSPNLLSRRLAPQILDGDSCLAFKMNNSPLMTGKLDQVGENNSGYVINTPSVQRRQLGTPNMMMKSPQTMNKSPKQSLSQYGVKFWQNKDLTQIEENKEDEAQDTVVEKKKDSIKKVNNVKNALKGLE